MRTTTPLAEAERWYRAGRFAEAGDAYRRALEATPDDVDALDGHGLSRRWDDAPPATDSDRAGALIAAGAGRRRLARELDIPEYEARRLLEAARPTTPSPADARSGDPSMNGASS